MRQTLMLLSLLVLTGCSIATAAPNALPPLAGVEGLSVIGTKKTITNHIFSLSSGKNCSTIRRDRGQTYCVEDEAVTPPELFCYKTLARVNCYEKQEPYGPNYDTVGHTVPGAEAPR